jgi:hypothetical protein
MGELPTLLYFKKKSIYSKHREEANRTKTGILYLSTYIDQLYVVFILDVSTP